MNQSEQFRDSLVGVLFNFLVVIGFICLVGAIDKTGENRAYNQYCAEQESLVVTSEKQEEVENICRNLFKQYNADIKLYSLYRNSESKEQKKYAKNAYKHAIETAEAYNEYIVRNVWVWEDIPQDIPLTLSTEIE